jgi:hypothetical protein
MSRFMLAAALSLLLASTLLARSNYTGYSGAPGATGTCASSCHGQPNGTVEITGFPDSYVPDSTYLITIAAVSGSSINNFNGSVRVDTGSTRAGTLSSGTNTTTYNVASETNGIRLSSNNRTSGTFNWTAPVSGTGTVRLYVAAFQGTSMNSGRNTALTLVSSEAVVETAPEITTSPNPAHNAVDVPNTTTLSWAGGAGATSFDIYLGPSEPLDFMGTTSEFTFNLPIELLEETTYLWRVDAINEFGTTTGNVWTFTTETAQLPLPGQATNPTPANSATDVPVLVPSISWTQADFASLYDVYFGTSEPLPLINSTSATAISFLEPREYSTTYLWRIDSRNITGTTTGETWSFTTEAFNSAHEELVPNEFSVGPAYPNPFNSSVRISLAIPNESPVTARIYNRTGQLVTTLFENAKLGNSTIEWNAQGYAAGTYFLKCDCAGSSTTKKLIYLP